MIEVELPDGTIVEFPDGTSQDVMKQALQRRFGGQQADTRQFGGGDALRSGLMQGMTFNFGDEILAGMMTPIEMGIDAFQGKPFDVGRSYGQALARNRGTDQQMQAANPMLATAGNIAGSIGSGMGLAKGGMTLMAGAKPTVLSMGTRGALEGAAYGAVSGAGAGEGLEDKASQALTGGALGGAFGGIAGGIGGALANRAVQKAVPTVEDLTQQAGALYGQARAQGVTATQHATQNLAFKIRNIAAANGLISPTGRINQSYGPIAEVIGTLDDYAKGTMTVPQMQAVRTVLSDAAGSPEKGIRRIAMKMLDEFDNFTSPLAPQLEAANALYHKAMKGDRIDTAIELAGSRAGQFSGSGFENALRTEFRALERQIIKGQLKGLSQPEIDAIKRVAQGGPIENALRLLGKLSPTGVVSMGAGFGLPFAVGNAFGGPALGTALGVGTMGTGLAARAAATGMTLNNAKLAALMARSGGQLPQAASGAIPAVTQGLIAGGGSQVPELPIPSIPLPMLRAKALN